MRSYRLGVEAVPRRSALAGVHHVKSKSRDYYYAWRGGPRLTAPYGSAEFIRQLHEAHTIRRAPDASKVSGLITQYRSSPAWTRDVGATTKKLWARQLNRIQTHFGTLSVKQFDRPDIKIDIRRWRDARSATPREADAGIQVLSRLLSFAVDEGRIRANPAFGIEPLYSSDRSHIIWEPDDLSRLEKSASKEVWWATRLAILTGLRQDDCRTLLWSHIGELAIEKPTRKGRRNGKQEGRRVALIPLFGELRELLASIPRRSTYVLTNTRGRPWASGLSDSFTDAAKRAGVEKHFHDLRGTAATKLYLASFTMREIAEIMAWDEASVDRIITRYVRRDAMLRDRIDRLDKTGKERAG